mmetsp:Transcript_1161/g.1892  ORF Transcript_1161/g.1892 Transcript_1161/m.1892 type:complete len:488 (+) Transcript_1161:233-1696(+)
MKQVNKTKPDKNKKTKTRIRSRDSQRTNIKHNEMENADPNMMQTQFTQQVMPQGAKVYVSSYSNYDLLAHQPHGTESQGLYGFRFHPKDISLTPMPLTQPAFVNRQDMQDDAQEQQSEHNHVIKNVTPNPAFMKVYDNKLYLVTERIDQEGSIYQFEMHPSGCLDLQSTLLAKGRSTCYIYKDRMGKYALVVNYWDATVSVVELGPQGELMQVTDVHRRPGYTYVEETKPKRIDHQQRRQGWSHAHCVIPAPEDKNALQFALYYVPDLGEECIHQLVLDRNNGTIHHAGSLFLKKGHGPRHMVFHPSNQYAYIVNELDSTVDLLHFDPQVAEEILDSTVQSNGATIPTNLISLQVKQTISTIPDGHVGKTHCAEIKVGPDGKFLYVANRFSDTIAVFRINSDRDGHLSLIEIVSSQGKTPRHFSFDPSGKFMIVANTDSDSLCVFHVMQDTGRLVFTGNMVNTPSPNYVLVVPEYEPAPGPVTRLGA